MANGANGVHLQLREALEDYIKSQYFGKSPILLSAVQNKLDQEGIHPMTDAEISALDFWRKPINDALQGEPIRAIDTEEHTAQLA